MQKLVLKKEGWCVMFTDKQKKIIMLLVNISLFGVSALLLYFFVPKILIWFLPFLIAYLFSHIAFNFASFLVKQFSIPVKLARLISFFLILTILGGLLTLLVMKIASELEMLIKDLPSYLIRIQNIPNNLSHILPEGLVQYLDNALENIDSEQIKTFGARILPALGNFALTVPAKIVFVIVTLLSTFYMTYDRESVDGFIRSLVPKRYKTTMHLAKKRVFSAIGGYIRAQLFLLCINFIILSIGLHLFKVNFALALAFLIAVFDALPIFGVGTILVPWSLISFINGNIALGICLLLLWGVAFLTRQILEPKIVSSQIGLHPLLTIISMYVGFQMIGIFGMIIFPILTLVTISVISNITNQDENDI